SRPRPDGRRFLELVEQPVSVPLLALHGRPDGNLPPRACRSDGAMVSASYRRVLVDGAGHFLPEEAPEEVTQLLLTWLRSLPLDWAWRARGPAQTWQTVAHLTGTSDSRHGGDARYGRGRHSQLTPVL